MSRIHPEQIDDLIASVCASAKYQAISPELIGAVGRRELAARKSLKQAIKATKNKLHQVAGAYFDIPPEYAAWLELLAAHTAPGERALPRPSDAGSIEAASGSELTIPHAQFRAACLAIMGHHASTRERLPILERFYRTLFAALPPAHSVLDVACGLNPLAIGWMPLAADAAYYACDLYADMAEFLNGFFRLAGVRGQAVQCDLLSGPPPVRVDVALVLKALPPLEQLDKHAGRDLLRALDARRIVVSFPTHSLGGRARGMAAHYDTRFRALAEAEGWPVERFEFNGELAFVVTKRSAD